MRRLVIVALGVIFLVTVPTLLAAQRCAGAASFAGGGPQFTTGVSFTPMARTISAGIMLGRNNALFGGGSYSHTTWDNSTVTLGGLQGALGYQFALGSRVQLCPVIGASRSSAMFYPGHGRTDWSSTAVGLGAMIGVTAVASKNVEFIPSLGMDYTSATSRASYDAYGTQLASGKWHGSAGTLSLTPGVVWRKAFTVSPSLALPLGIEHAATIYGIGLAYNFGHER